MADVIEQQGIRPPAVIVVGEVVALGSAQKPSALRETAHGQTPAPAAARPDRGRPRRAIDRRDRRALGPVGRSAGADFGRPRAALGAAGVLLQSDATLPANGSGRGPRLAAAVRRRPARDRLRPVGERGPLPRRPPRTRRWSIAGRRSTPISPSPAAKAWATFCVAFGPRPIA